MIDTAKAPYVDLDVTGLRLGRRVTGFDLESALKQPRATGWIEVSDPEGTAGALAYDAFTQRRTVRLWGGRQDGAELPLLTGIVTREPFAPPGSRGIVRIDLADGWAITDPVRISLDLKLHTPQGILAMILGQAALPAPPYLSPRGFTPRPRIVLDEWNLAIAVKEISTMWGLDKDVDEWDRRLGLTVDVPLDWIALFDGTGVFIWEEWRLSPPALLPPLLYTEDDLIAWSDQEQQGAEKGQIETFFDPIAAPGMRLVLPGDIDATGSHRVESRTHRFNGREFRTRINYGPIPGLTP